MSTSKRAGGSKGSQANGAPATGGAHSNKGSSSTADLPSVWSRAFSSGSQWPDKEEFLDVIYWMRQILGILIGLVWAILPLKGLIALILFGVVNAGLVYLYFSSFQSIDEEEYGGAWEVLKEGFMTSFASFLVTWVILYSALHFD